MRWLSLTDGPDDAHMDLLLSIKQGVTVLTEQQQATNQRLDSINKNFEALANSQVALQRQSDALSHDMQKVREEIGAIKQQGSVIHNARSNAMRFFMVPEVAPQQAKQGSGGASSSSSSNRAAPYWQRAMLGSQALDKAVRAVLETMYPGIPLPQAIFSNAISFPYSKQAVAADSSKEGYQMLVVTLTDSSLRGALFSVAKQLKEVYKITFTTEWTREEKEARRRIEASPAFQRALKQASNRGLKPYWDFGTCTFGRRTADSTVWSVDYLNKLVDGGEQDCPA
ncbi:hypothetical protein OEZ86_004114 [Tetradesmus obliquus]|nr:hypothetical protein OEZ86_004114 [Tetradesmus obliquus]